MHLDVRWTKDTLKKNIVSLIEKNRMQTGGIRITLTGGSSEDGYSISRPNLIISSLQFAAPGREQFEKGIALITFPYQRQLPSVKTIDYVMAIWLQPFIRENGADDVLYHFNGSFTECPRSNFFLVTSEGLILTPSNDILKGITRKKILELCKNNFEIDERIITVDDIKSAREAFITSTTKTILPVRRIDKIQFEVPGVITKNLYHSFHRIANPGI